MNNSKKVNILLSYTGKNKSELAKMLNTSNQNLSQKLKRDSLTTEELEEIAEKLGCRYYYGFELPDGTKI